MILAAIKRAIREFFLANDRFPNFIPVGLDAYLSVVTHLKGERVFFNSWTVDVATEVRRGIQSNSYFGACTVVVPFAHLGLTEVGEPNVAPTGLTRRD